VFQRKWIVCHHTILGIHVYPPLNPLPPNTRTKDEATDKEKAKNPIKEAAQLLL
jgi:hypothetical protein